jgi:hypothetical protein
MADAAAAVGLQAEFEPAVAQQGIDLRIAFQPLRHPAHPVGYRTRAIMVAIVEQMLTLAMQPLPVLDKAVGAHLRIGPDFGFELHRADSITGAATGRFGDKFGLAADSCGKVATRFGLDGASLSMLVS